VSPRQEGAAAACPASPDCCTISLLQCPVPSAQCPACHRRCCDHAMPTVYGHSPLLTPPPPPHPPHTHTRRYPEAIQHYSESLKRGPPSVNPEAFKTYSNLAACYTKLGAYPEGIKAADKCIELEPSFAKGYVRKGLLQVRAGGSCGAVRCAVAHCTWARAVTTGVGTRCQLRVGAGCWLVLQVDWNAPIA
jgi:tetratricopeptide (TPR) repeat protein